MHEFRIGDTVQLKSGGPLMTVTEPESASEKVGTSWFDTLAMLKTSNFHAGSLRKVENVGQDPKGTPVVRDDKIVKVEPKQGGDPSRPQ
jgi:uncharacterized protein YodC (DUF2158 family)